MIPSCALVLAACHASDMAPRAEHTTTGCTFGERVDAACAAIRDAKLLDDTGNVVPVSDASCFAHDLTADVTWDLIGRSPFRTVVKLGANGPTAALQPVAIDPIVMEWPTTGPSRPVRSVRLTIASSCVTGTGTTSTVNVGIPPLGPASCVAEARLTGGDPDWCVNPAGAETTYTIREQARFGRRVSHLAQLTIGSSEARLQMNGTSRVTKNVEAVRDIVDPIWKMPSEDDSVSCKHSALRIVEARRQSRWKAVLRYCDPIISMPRLTKAFEAH